MVKGIDAPVLAASAPGWLSAAIVVVAITLAVATVALMLARPRATDAGDPVARRVVDPMLILSALVVIALAVAAWLLR